MFVNEGEQFQKRGFVHSCDLGPAVVKRRGLSSSTRRPPSSPAASKHMISDIEAPRVSKCKWGKAITIRIAAE